MGVSAVTIVARWRARRIREAVAAYAATCTVERYDLERSQLHRLNVAWGESLRRSPWARSLRTRLDAPPQFKNWESFNALVPVQRKSDLVAVIAAADGEIKEEVAWRATGGTTAEPIRFPVFASE